MSRFVPARKIREHYEVSSQTLRAWAKRGEIPFKSFKHSQRTTWLYDINAVGKVHQDKICGPSPSLPTILYARVSSKKQNVDLERQIKLLQKEYPDGEIISDIGSGLNDHRRGFTKLVERICRNEIEKIVVTYKDRLTRFGFDFFKKVCDEHGVSIVVWSKENNAEDFKGSTKELEGDLLSVINVFVARRNGMRAGALRKARTKQSEEDKNLSDDESES